MSCWSMAWPPSRYFMTPWLGVGPGRLSGGELGLLEYPPGGGRAANNCRA